MNACAPSIFRFGDLSVRVAGTPDQPWFVAKDVCDALGIVDHRSSLRTIENDEKGVHSMLTHGGNQQLSTVNESGLYALIFQSRKESARKFRRWVTNEVLPQIRRTGGYGTVDSRVIDRLLREVSAIREKLESAPPPAPAAPALPEEPIWTMTEAAKPLGTTARHLYQMLVDQGMLVRTVDKSYTPTPRGDSLGWFRLVDRHGLRGQAYRCTTLTETGREKVADLWRTLSPTALPPARTVRRLPGPSIRKDKLMSSIRKNPGISKHRLQQICPMNGRYFRRYVTELEESGKIRIEDGLPRGKHAIYPVES